MTPAGYGPSGKDLLAPLERRPSAPAAGAGAEAEADGPEVSFEVFRRRFVWDGGERCFRKVAFNTKDTFGCGGEASCSLLSVA